VPWALCQRVSSRSASTWRLSAHHGRLLNHSALAAALQSPPWGRRSRPRVEGQRCVPGDIAALSSLPEGYIGLGGCQEEPEGGEGRQPCQGEHLEPPGDETPPRQRRAPQPRGLSRSAGAANEGQGRRPRGPMRLRRTPSPSRSSVT
jgi:hypothetical protein